MKRFSQIFFSYCLFLVIFIVSSREAKAQIKIGFVGPLTGQVAAFGQAAKNGIELAREENPRSFKNIQFIYEDDEFDPKKAISAYQKLRTTDDIDIIFPVGVKAGLVISPLAEQDHLPTVGLFYTAEPAIGRKYIIRFANYTQQYSKVLLNYLRSKGFHNFALLKTELEFMNGVTDGFRSNLRPDETIQIVESYNPTDLNFKNSILKLRKKHFDALGVFLITGQLSQFYRQAAALHFKPITFGTDFFSDKSEVRESGEGIEGAVFADNDISSDFRNRYATKFGNDSQIVFAGHAYDFTILVSQLLNNLKSSPSPDEILKLFSEVPPQNGVSGHYVFKQTAEGGKYFDFPIVVKQIKSGNIVNVID